MDKKHYLAFLEQVEEVASNLDEIPDELLGQLSYLVLTEIKERDDKRKEENVDSVHPATVALDDMEREWFSSHNAL